MPTTTNTSGSLTYIEGEYTGDWLKGEVEIPQHYSRDQIVVANTTGSAVTLNTGTVLGKITASGLFVQLNPGASDGSQNVAGILGPNAILAAAGANLSAPSGLTATGSTTGGALAAATYYYKVTAVDISGETVGSNEASATTTGTTSSVALAWTAVAGAASYKIYRGTSAGAESVFFTSATSSFTDVGGSSSAGTVPGSNTAAVPAVLGAWAITREATVSDINITYPAGITTPQTTTAISQMAALGIIVRRTA